MPSGIYTFPEGSPWGTAAAAGETVRAADGLGTDQSAVGSVPAAGVFCGARGVLGGEWAGEDWVGGREGRKLMLKERLTWPPPVRGIVSFQ